MDFDKEIFSEMVTFYGDVYHLPPLAAKIYAYLVFDFNRAGVSFEEFVEIFCASKSSVSSNLNLLLNLNIIKDFNKIDERKRFFVMNENYMKIRFHEIIDKMQKELSILDKLSAFRNIEDEKSLHKFQIYRSLFQKNILNIQETLDHM
ncbi:MAG: transcriptional regulator [Kaistella sp.]